MHYKPRVKLHDDEGNVFMRFSCLFKCLFPEQTMKKIWKFQKKNVCRIACRKNSSGSVLKSDLKFTQNS